MKIKICGITNIEDARLAEDLGADYIGLIFANSSLRKVNLLQAQKIIAELKHAQPVGVFVEQTAEEVQHHVDELKLAAVQLYTVPSKKIKNTLYIQALRIKNPTDLVAIPSSTADYILLDAYHEDAYGGMGVKFDWNFLPKDLAKIFLSGGINPGNVAEARALHPYAIDVCSGIETSPGKKDPTKLRKLFQEARQ